MLSFEYLINQHLHIISFKLLGPYAYHKNPKILDTRKFILITLKVEQDVVSLE